jgi:hypothetical protein
MTTNGQTLRLVLAWCVVGIPAIWGVSQVVAKSLALFR